MFIEFKLIATSINQVSRLYTEEGKRFLEDGRRCSSAQTASWVQTVNAQELVGEDTEHAQHSSTAVVALDVELEGLGLLVVVYVLYDLTFTSDVTGCLVVGLAVV